MVLYQAIYSFVQTQIDFGYYGFEESLPSMGDFCRLYHISIDTAAPVYHQLRKEGYISHSQRSGAKVMLKFGPKETERHIQRYFAARKASMLDLSKSVWPLFGWAQWLSLKYSSKEKADQLEQFTFEGRKPPTELWWLLNWKYGTLGNDILLRLARYIYLFFQGPFYSVRRNGRHFEDGFQSRKELIGILRRGDWEGLKGFLLNAQKMFSDAFLQFYNQDLTEQPPEEGIVFCWDAYKKSSQPRYTLAIELLKDINRGVYPEGSYLPTASKIAMDKNVSISTVRRTVSLLNNIGAIHSSKPYGACVLPAAQSTGHCDFTKPEMKKRLAGLAASLQMFALSAKAVAGITLASLDDDAISYWKQSLLGLQEGPLYELTAYRSLELLAELAPYQTIRDIYSELLRLLFWGNPLRGMREHEAVTRFFIPYHQQMIQALDSKDIEGYATVLEEILLHELQVIKEELLQKGIQEVETILIPDKQDIWDLSQASI